MYGYRREVNLPYAAAVQKAREELKKEGFGVITEVDVKDTLKKKLNVDFEDYIILGACNPPFAHQALKIEKGVGVMMPCNVVLWAEKGKTVVLAAMPTMLMALVNKPELKPLAEQIEAKIKKAVDSI